MRVDAEPGHDKPVPPAVADGELDLSAIGRTLWHKKWWALGPALVVAVLAAVGVNLVTPRYQSEARVLIEGHENVFLRPEAERMGDREQAVVDQEAVTSQVQLALSRDLARHVIKQLKLGERPEFDPVLRGASPLVSVLRLVGLAKDPLRMTPEERVLDAYFDRLVAYQVDKTRVIAIEFQSADPELAALAANTIAEDYLELQRTARREQTRAASEWLAGEIEDLRKKVADAEGKVEAFRARSNLFVGTNNTTLSNQQLGDVNTQLAALRAQKADAEAKARYIRELLRSGKLLESADFLNSELIRRLAEQRATLRAQLAEQSSTLLDGHPRIKELKAQIADLDREMRNEAERLVRSLENDAQIADARVATLSANLDQLKRQAATTNEQDVELRALEREAKAQRDLLESYLAKYREALARDSLSAMPADVRIISRAAVSNTPYFPKKLPFVLIATLATLFVATGFITTRELVAGTIYWPRRVVADLPAPETAGPQVDAPPLLDAGDAGSIRAGHSADVPPAIMPAPISVIAADLARAGEAGRRIAVVGVARNIGTTLTALALARMLARHGRIVLVDLALDAPNLAAFALDPRGPGIADLVTGTASFKEIITRDRLSRVHIVPAGRSITGPATVLSSERLGMGLDALSRAYDYVVLDAGAVASPAAGRIARFAQKAILVATGISEADAAEAAGRLAEAGFANVTVFSGSPPHPDSDQPDVEAAA